MTIYLQTDGVDDYIKTPSITIDSITMDCLVAIDSNQSQLASNPFLLDARFGGKYFKYNNTGGYVTTTGITSVNGLAKGTRISITFNFTSMTNVVYFFSANTGSLNVKGNIYKITCSLGGVTKAVYDMSTGTVQDQSGNGNHATLNGGTWLDDGTGGSTGTDGTTTFDVKQSIYSDSSLNVDTEQALYQDSSLAVDSKQFIYSDSFVTHDSKQVLFNDSFTIFDTLQEFFSDGIVGSIPFDMRFILYSDNSIQIDSKQAFYTEGMFQSDLLQILKEPTKPVISEIHLFGSSNASTHLTGKNVAPINIRTKKTASIHLKGGIQ